MRIDEIKKHPDFKWYAIFNGLLIVCFLVIGISLGQGDMIGALVFCLLVLPIIRICDKSLFGIFKVTE